MIKRHTRPNPSKNIAGGISEQRGADPHLERDARRSGPQRPDADRPAAGRRGQPRARRQEERSGARLSGGPQERKTNMAARLKEQYAKEVAPALKKEFGIDNVMAVPRLEKIVLNMGLGEAVANPKMLDGAVEELSAIAGQQAVVTKAKKSIATFKLRDRDADRRARHAARRPHVRVPRPPDQHRAAARARLPRRVRRRRSTGAATTRSASATTSSSRRSTTRRRTSRRA